MGISPTNGVSSGPALNNPVSIPQGGTGANTLAGAQANLGISSGTQGVARASYPYGSPILPALYPYPPTITASQTNPLASPKQGIVYTGQLGIHVNGSTAAGSNVLNFASTVTPYINSGLPLADTSKTGAIPAGALSGTVASTTVTMVDANGNAVNATGTGVNGTFDVIGFGPSTVLPMGFLAGTPSFSGNYQTYAQNTPTGLNGHMFALEFDYYGIGFSVGFQDFLNAQFWVWVDGQPCTADIATPSGYSGVNNGVNFLIVTFNNANDSAARLRRIRIYFGGTGMTPALSSIFLRDTDTISPPKNTYTKIGWIGDSYTEGNFGGPSSALCVPNLVSLLLGYAAPFNGGIGGTGYLNAGTQTVYGSPSRLAAAVAWGADIIVLQGGTNDNPATAAQEQAAAAAVISYLQTNSPNTKLFMWGCESPSSVLTASRKLVNTGLRAAAAAANIPFIDWIGNGWITGTGNSGATTGVGNADIFVYSDGLHYTAAGAEYYARLIANVIAANY